MFFNFGKTCRTACVWSTVLSTFSLMISVAALVISLRVLLPARPPESVLASDETAAADGTADGVLAAAPPAAQLNVNAPTSVLPGQYLTKGRSAVRTKKGTCTADRRGLSSFACPGTPTEDVCGQPPELSCYLGANEKCPTGMMWDPMCSCTCVKKN